MIDPVHEFEGKFSFWDEVWSDRVGPYATEQEARDALALYSAWLNHARKGKS